MKGRTSKVNNIGSEECDVPELSGIGKKRPEGTSAKLEGRTKNPADRQRRQHLYNWLEGLFFAMLPLFALFFADILLKVSLKTALYKMAANVSIMYIGITLLVSAMNDLQLEEEGRRKIYVAVIVTGAVLHTIIQFVEGQQNADHYNATVAITVNVGFFITALAIGLHQYLDTRGKSNG